MKKSLTPTKIKKLVPEDLNGISAGSPIFVVPTGKDCGGVYPCDTVATCDGTRCNRSIKVFGEN